MVLDSGCGCFDALRSMTGRARAGMRLELGDGAVPRGEKHGRGETRRKEPASRSIAMDASWSGRVAQLECRLEQRR